MADKEKIKIVENNENEGEDNNEEEDSDSGDASEESEEEDELMILERLSTAPPTEKTETKVPSTKKKGAPGIFSNDEMLLADFRKSNTPKKPRKKEVKEARSSSTEKKRHIISRKIEESKKKTKEAKEKKEEKEEVDRRIKSEKKEEKKEEKEEVDRRIKKKKSSKSRNNITLRKNQLMASLPLSGSSANLRRDKLKKSVVKRSLSYSDFSLSTNRKKKNISFAPNWEDLKKEVYRNLKYQNLIIDFFRNSPSVQPTTSTQLLISLIENSDYAPKYNNSTGRLLRISNENNNNNNNNNNIATHSQSDRNIPYYSLNRQRAKSVDQNTSAAFTSFSINKNEEKKITINNNNNNNNTNNNNNLPSLKPKNITKVSKSTGGSVSKRNTVMVHNAIIFKLQAKFEGYLTFKRSRRWVILDDSNLYVFKSAEDFKAPKIIISLRCTAVRKQVKENLIAFEVLTAGQNYLFFPDKDAANRTIDQWIEKIQEVCEKNVITSIEGQNNSMLTKNYSDLLSDEEKQVNPLLSPEQKELMQLALLEGNRICADCKSKDPEWASINLGVFICIECSGIHRSFGTHISKVRSIKLDKWEQSWVNQLKSVGNVNSNQIWLHSIPSGFDTITETSNLAERKKWLNLKYVEGRFRKDWDERQLEKNRSLSKSNSPSIQSPADFKEMFLQYLREDVSFRGEVRKILANTDGSSEQANNESVSETPQAETDS